MTDTLITNARLIVHGQILEGSVLIRAGRISGAFEPDQTPSGLDRPTTINLRGCYLGPGLIDLHIHGSTGVDVLQADNDEWRKLSDYMLTQGVTGYFPTFVPVSEPEYNRALSSIGSYLSSDQDPSRQGARILGVHFEGPFVSKKRCGALHPAHFRAYDGEISSIALFANPTYAAGAAAPRGVSTPLVSLMTVAPEIEGGLELIRDLKSRGVRPFIGHSVADVDCLDFALRAGARHITHFPNALEPLHHRRPGAVAWGLLHEEVTVDCIADFHHVHPLMLQLIYQNKGPNRMALISDAIPPTGLGDGDYKVWGDSINVRDGRTSLAGEGGSETIAGSVITLLDAVRNVVRLGVPLHEAVGMASLVPALAAGIDSEYGSIEPGKRADLVAFDDDLNVRLAIVDGQVALDTR